MNLGTNFNYTGSWSELRLWSRSCCLCVWIVQKARLLGRKEVVVVSAAGVSVQTEPNYSVSLSPSTSQSSAWDPPKSARQRTVKPCCTWAPYSPTLFSSRSSLVFWMREKISRKSSLYSGWWKSSSKSRATTLAVSGQFAAVWEDGGLCASCASPCGHRWQCCSSASYLACRALYWASTSLRSEMPRYLTTSARLTHEHSWS